MAKVEQMVQPINGMLKRSGDPHLAVLAYRSTPCTAVMWIKSLQALHGKKIEDNHTPDEATSNSILLGTTSQSSRMLANDAKLKAS